MSMDTIQQTWEWLLALSKTQLILLGAGTALLVAVSKIVRFLFVLVLLVVLLTTVFPELSKRYENSPLPAIMKELMRRGTEATQDSTPPPSPSPEKAK